MTVLERMTIDLLRRARAARGDDIHIVVGQLASEYGIEQVFVREKLVRLHKAEFIRLSACDAYGRVRPLEEWSDEEYFFFCGTDGNHKRIRLLVNGLEFLERLSAVAEERAAPKQAIGFHA